MTDEKIHATVQNYYAEKAKTGASCCGPNNLYPENLISDLPVGVADFSLGCGDPITLAGLQPGETVLDLGSGGGLDCFLAAKAVGPDGHVIGIDMTPEMIQRARQAAEKMNAANVDFRQGFLEALPVDENSIDTVISNCVINLSPDKSIVLGEVYRVLKPGGRIAISDIVSAGEIPQDILEMQDSWSSCAAGALPVEQLRGILDEQGFCDIQIKALGEDNTPLGDFPAVPLFSALISAQKPE